LFQLAPGPLQSWNAKVPADSPTAPNALPAGRFSRWVVISVVLVFVGLGALWYVCNWFSTRGPGTFIPYHPTYQLTQDALLAHLKGLPGEVVNTQGAQGPYELVSSFVGNPNHAGDGFSIITQLGKQPEVRWPATPGCYYVATYFCNKAGEGFYAVRKIPNDTPLKTW
jgi:hypothetical protein